MAFERRSSSLLPIAVRCFRAAVFLLAALALFAEPAGADSDADLIVDEVGEGLSAIETEQCVEDFGGGAKAFRGERGLLCILRSPAINEAMIAANVTGFREPNGIDFSIGDVEPSMAQILDADTNNPMYVAVFGAGEYFYSIFFIQSIDDPTFDPQAFVTGLVHDHLALVPMAAENRDSSDPSEEDSELDASSLPKSSDSGATVDGDLEALLVDVDWLNRLGDPIPDVHRTGEIIAVDELSNAFIDGTSSILQLYEAPDGQIVGVFISRYKFSLFAAAALGDEASLGVDWSEVFYRLDQRDDLAMVRPGADGPGEPP